MKSSLKAALILFSIILVASTIAGSATTSTVLATFTTPGSYIWTVPIGITSLTFHVFGASGGRVANGNIAVGVGGLGGMAIASFHVTPGQKFQIIVGGRGGDNNVATGGAGGFNGGGAGNNSSEFNSSGTLGGGGGGGASDVRIGGKGNPCVTSQFGCGYSDRIVVAGGGGGAGGSSIAITFATNGGNGGGVAGQNGAPVQSFVGVGGTQEFGGVPGGCDASNFVACSGSFGTGGTAVGGDSTSGGGGGGAGWYGGSTGEPEFGGGGGSGFINRFAISGSFSTSTSLGDGKVVVTTP